MKRAIYFDTLGMKIEESAQQESAANSFDDGAPSSTGYGDARNGSNGTENFFSQGGKDVEPQRSEVASRGKDLILRFAQTTAGNAESTANNGKSQESTAEATAENANTSPTGSSVASSSEKDAYHSPAGSSASSTADENISLQEGSEASSVDKQVTVEQLTREARELCLKRIESGLSANCCAHLVSVQVLSSDTSKDWADTFLSLTDGALWSTTYFSLGRLHGEAAPEDELSPHPVVQVLDFKGKGCDVDFEECSGASTGFALVVKVPGYKTVKIAPKRFRHLAVWGAALMQVAATLSIPPKKPSQHLRAPKNTASASASASAAATAPVGKASSYPTIPFKNDDPESLEARRLSMTRYHHPLLSVPSPPRNRSRSMPPAPPLFPMAFATAEALAPPVKKLTRRAVHSPPPSPPAPASITDVNYPEASSSSTTNTNNDNAAPSGRLTPPGIPMASVVPDEGPSLYSNTPSLESTRDYYMVPQVRNFPQYNVENHASSYGRPQRGSSVSRPSGVPAGSGLSFQPIDSRVSLSLPRSGPSPETTKRTTPLTWAQAYRKSMTRRSRGVPGKTKSWI